MEIELFKNVLKARKHSSVLRSFVSDVAAVMAAECVCLDVRIHSDLARFFFQIACSCCTSETCAAGLRCPVNGFVCVLTGTTRVH